LAVDVLDSLIKGVAVIGPDGRLLYQNSRFAELFKKGWEKKPELVFGADEPGQNLGSHYRDVTANGRTLRVRKTKLGKNLLITADDITKVVKDQLRSDRQARTDPLTLLGNRLLFQEQAAEAFAHINRFGGHGAVLMVDIDHFKNINDSFGHSLGDDVLRLVADRIKSVLQENESVARLGGDEFVILQRGLPHSRGPQELAERIVDVVGRPYAVQGQLLHLGASIGTALIPQHGTHYSEIMRRADIALYRAKSDGRGTHRIFSVELEEEKERRRLLELALRRGLAFSPNSISLRTVLLVSRHFCAGIAHFAVTSRPLPSFRLLKNLA
jgi:diguanylate cyclase (GGDEF)-like protein